MFAFLINLSYDGMDIGADLSLYLPPKSPTALSSYDQGQNGTVLSETKFPSNAFRESPSFLHKNVTVQTPSQSSRAMQTLQR